MKQKTETENGFKQTEIGSIPEDWDVVNLSDNSVADLIMGQSPYSSTYNQDGVGLPFMQGKAEFGRIYPNPDKWCSSPSRVAEQKDVLMSVRAPVGDVNIAPFKCAIGRGLAAIRAKQKSKFLYLFFYLYFAKKRLEDEGTGSTFKAINKGVLENFKIALPEIDEQKNIIAVLSKLQQAIAQQEQIIAKTKELKRSLMQRLFTYGLRGEELKETEIGLMPESWDVKSIGEIAPFEGGFAFKSQDYKKTGVRLLKIANVSFGKAIWEDVSFLPEEYLTQYKEYVLNESDIVMAMTRPIVLGGIKVAKLSSRDCPCLLNQRVGRFKPAIMTNPEFLYQFLFTKHFVNHILYCAGGSQQPNISAKKIEECLMPFPELDEQNQIAEVLSQIDQKIGNELFKKMNLEYLFKAMLQLLMTGQVRVKDIDFGKEYE